MTYEQLMTQYWGAVVPMAKRFGVDPWTCVKIRRLEPQGGEDLKLSLRDHPSFTENVQYEFALSVLEKRPVFSGDLLCDSADTTSPPWRCEGCELDGLLRFNNGRGNMWLDHLFLRGQLTWGAPKGREITVNGKKFDAPVKLSDKGQATLTVALNGVEHQFRFEEYASAIGVFHEILGSLNEK